MPKKHENSWKMHEIPKMDFPPFCFISILWRPETSPQRHRRPYPTLDHSARNRGALPASHSWRNSTTQEKIENEILSKISKTFQILGNFSGKYFPLKIISYGCLASPCRRNYSERVANPLVFWKNHHHRDFFLEKSNFRKFSDFTKIKFFLGFFSETKFFGKNIFP